MMRVKLEARQMWTVMRLGGVSRQEDRRALEVLCSTVPTEMVSALSGKATAKDAWDAIAAARVGSDRARKSALQKFREECDNLAFKPGEEVDDFALRLSSLRQQLEQYGDYEITEEEMDGESFPDGGKLYYATEHCQCHVCRKKGGSRQTQEWEATWWR
jgi:hypothetical protein